MISLARFCIVLITVSSDKKICEYYTYKELNNIMNKTNDIGIFYNNIEYINNQF